MNPQAQWNEENFYPDAVIRIRDLLKAAFQADGTFKGFYDGDPDPVGKSVLPCISVTETDMAFDVGATQTDRNTHTLLIKIMFNKKDDFGAALSDPQVDLTSRKMRWIVLGRDPTTNNYLPNSVMGVLRPNFTMGNYAIGNSGKVTWGVNEREEVDGVATAEAHIMITVEELMVIPTRT